MQLKKTFTTICLLLLISKGYSQHKAADLSIITKYANKSISTRTVHDSLALYTCNIQITVDEKNSYKPIIVANDTVALNAVLGLQRGLKEFDYKPFMGSEKQVKFILPVSVIVLDSSYKPKILPAYLDNRIDKLFYFPKADEKIKVIYVPPVNMMIDMKVYN